jgi:hypothetical protein
MSTAHNISKIFLDHKNAGNLIKGNNYEYSNSHKIGLNFECVNDGNTQVLKKDGEVVWTSKNDNLNNQPELNIMAEVTKIDMREAVEAIIKRAKDSKNPDEALKFSQAACNTANAFRILFDMDLDKGTPTT